MVQNGRMSRYFKNLFSITLALMDVHYYYYYYYYYTIFIKRLSNKTITLSAVQNTLNVNPINKSKNSNKSQE